MKIIKFFLFLISFFINIQMQAALFDDFPTEVKQLICEHINYENHVYTMRSLGLFRLTSRKHLCVLDNYTASNVLVSDELRKLLLSSNSQKHIIDNCYDFNFIIQRVCRSNTSDELMAGLCKKIIAVKKGISQNVGPISLVDSTFKCVSEPEHYKRSLEHLIESYKIKTLEVLVNAHFPVSIRTPHFSFEGIDHLRWIKRHMPLEKKDECDRLNAIEKVLDKGVGMYQSRLFSFVPDFILDPIDQKDGTFLLRSNAGSILLNRLSFEHVMTPICRIS